jgi:diadenosine tetraphosphatase ApaH/serine/threonine PP2A family protein phosphatase
MIYGIISDIHGNLQALRAAVAVLREEEVDSILCLGDLVGYGANPNEVITEAREVMDVCVAGNHDFGAVGKTDLSIFNSTAHTACLWTGKVLTADFREYLEELPLTHIADLFTLVHASPERPSLWNYVITYGEVLENMRAFTTPVCFIGHSHVPFLAEQSEDGALTAHKSPFCEIRPAARYLINPGSVGQPRDGSPEAAFATLDTTSMRVEIRRVPYDVKGAQAEIMAAGLPPSLAERLALGY